MWAKSYDNPNVIFKSRYFDGNKYYVTINLRDNSRFSYAKHEDRVHISFDSNINLIVRNAHGDYEYSNPTTVKISIPNSRLTSEGKLRDNKYSQLIYNNILNFIHDNGFELMRNEKVASEKYGTSYDVAITIPYL